MDANARGRLISESRSRFVRTLFVPIILVGGLALHASTNAEARVDPLIVTLYVAADANIYGAGHASAPEPGGGGGGQLPPSFTFPVVEGQVVSFLSVTGSISADGGFTYNGPDGSLGPITVRPWEGISGIKDSSGGFYLVGVFLTDAEPADPAPRAYDFTNRHDIRVLYPQVGQVFFIGDGMGSAGSQRFRVPPGASRVFLGLADAPNGRGVPGGYADNLGTLEATFIIRPASG